MVFLRKHIGVWFAFIRYDCYKIFKVGMHVLEAEFIRGTACINRIFSLPTIMPMIN